jgi:hypothetical protein
LHYQVYLTNATGTPINSAMTAIRFNLYTTGGTKLYSEFVVVPVTNGQFSATIGNQVYDGDFVTGAGGVEFASAGNDFAEYLQKRDPNEVLEPNAMHTH